jgi:hypothetical protein
MARKIEIILAHSSTESYKCHASIYMDGQFDENIEAKDRFELTKKIKNHLDAIVW